MMEESQIHYDPAADFYALLGVSPGATDAEIKKAHKRAAKKIHPDLNPDKKEWATRQFQLINSAYEVLSKPSTRTPYDRERWKALARRKMAAAAEMEVESPRKVRRREKSPDRIITTIFLAMFGLMLLVVFGIIVVSAITKALSR